MITNIEINGKTYECKLTSKRCIQLERKFGKNPLSMFMTGLPKLSDAITVFQYSAALENEDEAIDLYDAYIEEGHSMPEFIDFVMQIFKDSGFLRKDENDQKN